MGGRQDRRGSLRPRRREVEEVVRIWLAKFERNMRVSFSFGRREILFDGKGKTR